jgi:LacI family transcriptional regulator
MITIKDIARLAGVSIGTVDRVLHNRGRVAKETEKTIKEIIKKYNYQPNIYASQLKKGQQYKLAVLMPKQSQDGGYWNIPLKGIKKAQKELTRYNIQIDIYFYDKYNETTFDTAFNKILRATYDGLLIAPVLLDMVSKLIKELPENIPYVFFDSFLPDSKHISFIGQDAYMSGYVGAKLMNYLLYNTKEVVTFKFLPEDYHINERINGFVDYFKNNKVNVKIYDIKGHDLSDSTYEQIDNVIKSTPQLNGIFFPTALTYLAARSLESVNRKVYLIGYDLLNENKKYLKNDLIDFIIDQEPYKQGYEGIYILYKHIILKEKIKNKILLPINIVMKENLEYFYSL